LVPLGDIEPASREPAPGATIEERQATEAIKLLLGVGDPLIGRQLRYDALAMEFVELRMHRDPNCPVCSKNPDQIHFIDYEQFCAAPARAQALPTIQEAVA